MQEAAEVASQRSPGPANFVVACGRGNNGGDGYAIARILHSHGLTACALELVAPTAPSDAFTMHQAAQAMGVVRQFAADARCDEPGLVVVDAVFGTGLCRAPSGVELEAIHWINRCGAAGARVYSIDIPSGIDCDSGVPLGTSRDAVRASCTITMVCPKVGFPEAMRGGFLGRVHQVPIGGPPHTHGGILE